MSKQEGTVSLGKSTQESRSVPLVLNKPPIRMGGTSTPPVVKASGAEQPEIESKATAEPVPKTGLPASDPLRTKGEAEVTADPTVEKVEAAQSVEPPKAKVETVVQQTQPKVEAKEKSKEPTDPKSAGQSAPLMSIAGIKGVLGFGHSKPERPPPPVSQAELTQLEQDEEADFNAAVQESLKAPTSPQVQSGAQSSSMGATDLDQRESDLLTQLDKLSTEALRLETATNPSIRDKSRMRTIEGVTDGIVKQLEEIAQQRLRSSGTAMSSQPGVVQSALPIAAPPTIKPEVSSKTPKAVTPHKREPLTIETLLQGITGQQDPSAVLSRAFTPAVPVEEAQQSVALSDGPPEPVRVRSRERTPVRHPRSPTPQKEVQQVFPAIEDGSPPRRELEPEHHRERERTPHREHSHERRQRRRRSPTPSKDRSHHRRRRSSSPKQDRHIEERQRSPTPPKEQSHRRRRHSPTPSHESVVEERDPSPTPVREPSRERRERRVRRHTPEPSVTSREERRRSPSPKAVTSESPKASTKKSKKSGKKDKKEKKESKSGRRAERIESIEERAPREERSRSTRRPEESQRQPPQAISVEASETDDHPPKGDRPLATQDKPARQRLRFDPSREHVVAQRLKEKRKAVITPREDKSDPVAEGPTDAEAEVRQRRRHPPPPPPASSIRQPQSGRRSLAFARPPPRRESVTESSQISERPPLRVRSQETPPQRPMPTRVLATPTVGTSAPPRLQVASGRAVRGDSYDQSQVRDDPAHRPQYHQERQEWGSSQRRVPSMGRRESLHTWAGHQQSGQQYQDWSYRPPSTQEYWYDPQQGHPQGYPQQLSAAQQWYPQQQQQRPQQQLPNLPPPVYPPGMQACAQPPPGLSQNVQRAGQGVITQGASMQYGTAASRQQSPAGSQPPQDRQQSSYSQQYQHTGGYFRQGYQ